MLDKKAAAGAVEKWSKSVMTQINYKKVFSNVCDILNKKHKVPIEIINEYISLRKNPIDAPQEILYCIIETIDSISKDKKILDYFTEDEIKTYKNYKYKKETIKFPLKYNVVQVTDTQWIGRITVKELMQLSDLIIYNENTQRSLKKNTSNGVETYSIFLNRNALRKITESYQSETYIPNTITLNIPEEADFKYENGNLIFKELKSLDILDGYHRYVAMSNLYSLDNTFDYPMEIRWVTFSEDKAKQFIWQEDQKTQMRKNESEAFNQNNPGNQVINMLNQVTLLKNIIGLNSNINAGDASIFINLIWFSKIKHTYSRKEIVEVKKKLEKELINILNEYPEAFDKKWSRREIGGLFVCIYHEDINSLYDYINFINEREVVVKSNTNKGDLKNLEEAYQTFKS